MPFKYLIYVCNADWLTETWHNATGESYCI